MATKTYYEKLKDPRWQNGIKLTEPYSSMKNDFKDFNPDSNGRKPF